MVTVTVTLSGAAPDEGATVALRHRVQQGWPAGQEDGPGVAGFDPVRMPDSIVVPAGSSSARAAANLGQPIDLLTPYLFYVRASYRGYETPEAGPMEASG